MIRWVTRKQIHAYVHDVLGIEVGEQTIAVWCNKGYFGKDDGGHPKRYLWSVVEQSAENIPDNRVIVSDEEVQEILASAGEKNVVLARRYGVHESYISRIRKGERRTSHE